MFWNLLTITPIKNAQGKVTKFVGVQASGSGNLPGCRRAQGPTSAPAPVPAPVDGFPSVSLSDVSILCAGGCHQQDRGQGRVGQVAGALR